MRRIAEMGKNWIFALISVFRRFPVKFLWVLVVGELLNEFLTLLQLVLGCGGRFEGV
ncbi:hypothetical protein RchiOBHm_Chr5g0009601 [Rosa chinensis]|uniref:Uncharacterized protein n=1 Tax=Rosa chinensis TaxID=74649 RepID=A0A2P6Q4D2_ROSCH|nr:hypothetical protein RchiOBHm_Chr5g0009601 [Rosa chinensis]